MSGLQFSALQPLIIAGALPLVLMIIIAIKRTHRLVMNLTVVGLLLAALSVCAVRQITPVDIVGLLRVDNYALFYFVLIFMGTIFTVLPAYAYLERRFTGNKEEFYLLITTASVGSAVLAASTHFVTFFLGLEVLSVSLYGLIAYLRDEQKALEAGIKYLLLAAVSSAFLVFGMALIYARVGSMEFNVLMQHFAQAEAHDLMAIAGLGLMVIGFGFKLAIVPFHMWSPDVYEGAPAPVTAYIASVSKGGILALLFRFFMNFEVSASAHLYLLFVILSVATMFVGNFLALLQTNVKRMLAYSSIAHFGYILVAFVAGNAQGSFKGVEAATFYIVSYFATIIGAFILVGVFSDKEREALDNSDYRGMYWRHPWLSVIFSAMLFSLAGIPLTAGFIGKYFILASGVASAQWLLVIILIVNSALGVYYYLRVVVEMFTPAEKGAKVMKPNLGLATGVLLTILTFVLLYLGIYPTQIVAAIQASLAG